MYIDGNPSKFLQGHSVVGSDDIQGLMLTVYARILSLLNIPHDLASYKAVIAGQYKISRVDINYMYSLSTLENVRSWLYAAEFKAKTRHGRACGKGGTVYLGKSNGCSDFIIFPGEVYQIDIGCDKLLTIKDVLSWVFYCLTFWYVFTSLTSLLRKGGE